MSIQAKRPLRKRKEKAAHSPFADILGKFYVSQELGRGQIVEETIPGQFKAECYASPTQPPPYIKYLSVEQLTEILICKDRTTWEGLLCEVDEPCECGECSEGECEDLIPEDAPTNVFLPEDCLMERIATRKNIARLEMQDPWIASRK